ncbi:MAG: YfhO family protein, partial [Pyrinomonadaceae bacterium]
SPVVAALSPSETTAATTSAEVTSYEPNRIEVKTVADAASILVLAENHYPGWRAYLDGRAAGILRVNYNERGVLLPPGEHRVEFVYRPKSVLLGLLISLLTAAALAVWCWRPVAFNGRARRGGVDAVAARGE